MSVDDSNFYGSAEQLSMMAEIATMMESMPQSPAKRRRRPNTPLLLPLDDPYTVTEGLILDLNKPKRKRVPEFDPASGEWVDVRRFDRMPITIEEAEESERVSKVPHGAYFVSLAHKRIMGIIQLHDRWLKKTKNQCSEYAEVQKDLMDFFSMMLANFDQRYAVYTTHPQFESIGKTRKRCSSTK